MWKESLGIAERSDVLKLKITNWFSKYDEWLDVEKNVVEYLKR